MGDFNAPNINWVTGDLEGARRIERQLHSNITDNFLKQHITMSTRFSENSNSILDLVFTKEEGDIRNVSIINPVGASDHGIITCEFICKWKSRAKPRRGRAYYKGNYKTIEDKLIAITWAESFRNITTNDCTQLYISETKKLMDENIPLGLSKDYREPWMNARRMGMWRKKQTTYERALRYGSRRNWRSYRDARDKLRKTMRKGRRKHEKMLSAEARNNKRAFFKYCNSRMTVKPEIITVKDQNGQLVDDDKEIAEVMVDYFSTVYTDHRGAQMPKMDDMTDEQIDDIIFTPESVEKQLQNLNINKSCGPDEIHPHVLQKTAKAMSVPLALIFQKSLNEGICPDEWKRANVTPIHKKGDRTEPSNYRPVSLTSQVCKVMESMIRIVIINFLVRKNLLNNAQHGFREGRSCLTNLLETLEKWTEIIEDGDCIDVAYLDFRKAFDLVYHKQRSGADYGFE